MKKALYTLMTLIFLMMLVKTSSVEANDMIQSLDNDPDGQVEFKFPNEEEGQTALSDFPIRVRLEGLGKEEVKIRMIWDINNPNSDVVIPVMIEEVEPVELKMLNEEVHTSNVRVSFTAMPNPYYRGVIYLTDLSGQEGLQMIIPNYGVGIDPEVGEVYQLMTQVEEGGEAPNEELPEESDYQYLLDINELDRIFLDWQEDNGQTFYRYYPDNESEYNLKNQTFEEFLDNIMFYDERIQFLETEGYTLHAVYSTARPGAELDSETTTYLMLDYYGRPKVWVNEEDDGSQLNSFVLTQNEEVFDLFGRWYYQEDESDVESIEQSTAESEGNPNLSVMLRDRDQSYSPEIALEYLRAAWLEGVPAVGIQLGKTEFEDTEKQIVDKIVFEEKAPGYYYFHRYGGGNGTSFDFFLHQGNIVTIVRKAAGISYGILDSETYESIGGAQLTSEEVEDLEEIEKIIMQ